TVQRAKPFDVICDLQFSKKDETRKRRKHARGERGEFSSPAEMTGEPLLSLAHVVPSSRARSLIVRRTRLRGTWSGRGLAARFDYTLEEFQKVGALFWAWIQAGMPPLP